MPSLVWASNYPGRVGSRICSLPGRGDVDATTSEVEVENRRPLLLHQALVPKQTSREDQE
jgi:hypothetical protein